MPGSGLLLCGSTGRRRRRGGVFPALEEKGLWGPQKGLETSEYQPPPREGVALRQPGLRRVTGVPRPRDGRGSRQRQRRGAGSRRPGREPRVGRSKPLEPRGSVHSQRGTEREGAAAEMRNPHPDTNIPIITADGSWTFPRKGQEGLADSCIKHEGHEGGGGQASGHAHGRKPGAQEGGAVGVGGPRLLRSAHPGVVPDERPGGHAPLQRPQTRRCRSGAALW